VYDPGGAGQEPIPSVSNRTFPMTRSLKLTAVVSLIAYLSGAAALLWRREAA
jgi:hypothetical protein